MMKLDPEKLTIDMRSLSRGVNRGSFTIPMDRIDLNIEDIEPEKCEAMLELMVDFKDETVICTGVLDAAFRTPCARCLKPAFFSITEPIYREYSWNCNSSDELEVELISRTGELDILDAVREAVLLSIPGKPLCSPDCTGICYN